MNTILQRGAELLIRWLKFNVQLFKQNLLYIPNITFSVLIFTLFSDIPFALIIPVFMIIAVSLFALIQITQNLIALGKHIYDALSNRQPIVEDPYRAHDLSDYFELNGHYRRTFAEAPIPEPTASARDLTHRYKEAKKHISSERKAKLRQEISHHNYKCAFSYELMTEPCRTPHSGDQWVERQYLETHVRRFGTDPFATQHRMSEADIHIDSTQQENILNFVRGLEREVQTPSDLSPSITP